MSGDKIFLDTNVLVYAHDVSAGPKHHKAKEILLDLWEKGNGIVSTQVLQEFYVVVTRKIPRPLSPGRAREIVESLLYWDVVVNDGEAVLEAIDVSERHKLSFWDGLVVQAAMRGGAEVLLSEDLNPGQVINGVKVENPFLG